MAAEAETKVVDMEVPEVAAGEDGGKVDVAEGDDAEMDGEDGEAPDMAGLEAMMGGMGGGEGGAGGMDMNALMAMLGKGGGKGGDGGGMGGMADMMGGMGGMGGGMGGMGGMGGGMGGMGGKGGGKGAQKDEGDGEEKTAEKWVWSQKGEEIHIRIALDPPATSKKDVNIKFKANTLLVSVRGDSIIDGALGGKVEADECTWCFSPTKDELQLMLTKVEGKTEAWRDLLA